MSLTPENCHVRFIGHWGNRQISLRVSHQIFVWNTWSLQLLSEINKAEIPCVKTNV